MTSLQAAENQIRLARRKFLRDIGFVPITWPGVLCTRVFFCQPWRIPPCLGLNFWIAFFRAAGFRMVKPLR